MNEAGLRADSGWGNQAAVISPGESNLILERFGRGCAAATFRGAAAFAVAWTGATAFFEPSFAGSDCFAAFRETGFWGAFFGAAFFRAAFFGATFLGATFFEATFFEATFFEAAFFGAFLARPFFAAFFAAGREAGFALFRARFAGAFAFAAFAFTAIRFPAADFLEGEAAFRTGALFPPCFPAEVGFVLEGVGFLDAALFLETALPFTDFFLEAAVALRPAFFPFAAGIKELRSVHEHAIVNEVRNIPTSPGEFHSFRGVDAEKSGGGRREGGVLRREYESAVFRRFRSYFVRTVRT